MPTSSVDHPAETAGGYKQFNTNQRLDSTDMDEIGKIGVQGLMAWLSRFLEDDHRTSFTAGFFGDDALVVFNSGLQVDVQRGMGIQWHNQVDSDEGGYDLPYKPLVVPFTPVTLDAHDANPRIDIISVAPAFDDDDQDDRQVYSGGSFSPQTLYLAQRFGATVTLTKGTAAATPSPPATPAGEIKLCEIDVPATSGDPSVRDFRPALTLANSLQGPLLAAHVADAVPGGPECQPTLASGVGVDVGAGEVFLGGRRYRAPATHALSPLYGGDNSSGQDRIDRIYLACADGLAVPSVALGTPGTPPSAPATPAGGFDLATVYIPDAGTDYNDLTDVRAFAPIAGTQIRLETINNNRLVDDTIEAAKLATKPVNPALSKGTETSDKIRVTVTSEDWDGNAIAEQIVYEVTLHGATYTPIPDGAAESFRIELVTGSHYSGHSTDETRGLKQADSSGVLVMDIFDSASGGVDSVWVRVIPMNRPGNAAVIELDFA